MITVTRSQIKYDAGTWPDEPTIYYVEHDHDLLADWVVGVDGTAAECAGAAHLFAREYEQIVDDPAFRGMRKRRL